MLEEAIEKGFVDTSTVYIDGTHIKANANIHKNEKVLVKKEAKTYGEQLRKEINETGKAKGKAV